MRAMWSGTVSFGLVNIPVKLYAAVKTDAYHMNYLRKDDLCPISYKKVCRRTGEEVPYEDIVRGYEYRKGDFVVLNEEDFARADMKRSYSIDIEVFVDEKDVDIKYLEKPYFLEPEKGAQKSYALFREAMTKSGKVGIGKFVLKDREHLVMLKPQDEVIILEQMRFDDVFKDHKDLKLPGAQRIAANQMELALELINKLAGKFKPSDFKDTYEEKLKEIIEAKKKGKTVHIEKKVPEATEETDILARLKESLAAAASK